MMAAVEARQWDGVVTTATDLVSWMLANGATARYHDDPSAIAIDVPGGTRMAVPGDWIVREPSGFFPWQDDAFQRARELDSGEDPVDWVCGRCERGQCGRCADPDCTCCNGNPGESWQRST
jgi:hypothetical protein